MVRYAGNCRLGRRFLNRVFGKVAKRPDEACWELESFVVNVICGIDFGGDVHDEWDVYRFNEVLLLDSPDLVTRQIWQHWFANKANGWPVVEKQGDIMAWTWFENSRQMGDWVPIGQPCPIVFKLVERADGKGFNKVRIE